MASHWGKVDPDSVVDRLPQPYRSINKVIEDVLSGVEEGIVAIEARRRSEEYEFNLQQAPSSGYVAVHGRVTCTYVEPQGTSRLVVGTSHGEVVLIDTRTQKILAQKHAFGDTEAVCGVALCSDGRYWEDPSLRPSAKVIVAGTWTPQVLIYDVCRQQYGVALMPACVVRLPGTDAEAAPADPPRILQQLHAKAAIGLVWVVAALADGTVRVYACPLGPPESRGRGRHDSVEPIREDEDEVDSGPATGEEFADAVQVETPVYCFQVPSLAPMPGMAEPRMDALGLAVFGMCPEGRNTSRARHTAGVAQEPLHVFVSSSASNVIVAYSLRAPERPARAIEGDDVGEFLKQAPTKPGDLSQPAEPTTIAPRRRWMLPANTTAVGVSSNGAIFAAGGAQGSLALVDTSSGPWLNNMLPGHYAAVAALSFHRAEVLVSFGADSWVHHYCTKTDTMLFRCLCAPPPSPPPAVDVVASQTLPLALTLDAAGGLRLLDLGRGSKIARPVCAEQFVVSSYRPGTGSPDTSPAFFPSDGAADPVPPPESARRPSQLLAQAEGFCVLCQADVPDPPPVAADDGEADAAGGADAAPDGVPGVPGGPSGDAEESAFFFFFDQSAVLPYIFPGVAARMGTGEALEKFFGGLSPEELVTPPPPSKSPAPPTESVASPISRANTRPNFARSTTRLSQTSIKSARFSAADREREQRDEESNGAVAVLTAENLRRMTKPALGRSMTNASLAYEPTEAGTVAEPPPEPARSGAHAPPEAWQASVRRRLRSTTAERDSRQYRLRKRFEQIRKEISDA